MNTDEAESIYQRIFTAFPLMRDWLAKQENPKGTYKIWCGVLAGVDATDCGRIADRLIAGDLPLPAAYERDTLPQRLRREANELRANRLERERMHQLHIQATEGKTESQRFVPAMRAARKIGLMVRDGKLSHEDNERMVEELVAWHRGQTHERPAAFDCEPMKGSELQRRYELTQQLEKESSSR